MEISVLRHDNMFVAIFNFVIQVRENLFVSWFVSFGCNILFRNSPDIALSRVYTILPVSFRSTGSLVIDRGEL